MYIEIVEDQETFGLAIGDSGFTLRRLNSEVYKDIERRHTKKTKNLRTGDWMREADDHAINEDILDFVIVDWTVIKSPVTGDDVACTKETKQKLPGSVKLQILDACDAGSISDQKKTS